MAFWDMYKTPLEKAIEARGQKVMAGGYNFWQDPQFRPAAEGIRTSGARNLEDLTAVLPRAKVGGPAAAKMLENASARTSGDVLNLGTNMATTLPDKYIGEGATAGGAGWNRAMDLANLMEKYKTRHTQTQAQKQQAQASAGSEIGGGTASGVSSGMGGCKKYIFTAGGGITYQSRVVSEMFYPIENDFIHIGYRKMASWIVPVMKRNKLVQWVIQKTMIDPINKFSEAHIADKKWKQLFYCPFGLFWTRFWDMYGRIKT